MALPAAIAVAKESSDACLPINATAARSSARASKTHLRRCWKLGQRASLHADAGGTIGAFSGEPAHMRHVE
jgi:hypothetical protein